MTRIVASALLVVGLASSAPADLVDTFEDLNPGSNTYSNPTSTTTLVSGGNSFNHVYDSTYDAWYGWSISSKTDGSPSLVYDTNNYTKDLQYQYSAVTGSGSGPNSTGTYAVGYTVGPIPSQGPPPPQDDSVVNLAAGTTPVSVDVTNDVYTYEVLKYGNSFTHAFSTANNDYLELTIAGYSGLNGQGSQVGSPVTFYLANFQGSNDFIVDTWKTIDLTPLAGARSLRFGLISSDNNPTYGINDPAYFAADNLVTAVPEPASAWLALTGLAVGAVACGLRRSRGMIRNSEGRDA